MKYMDIFNAKFQASASSAGTRWVDVTCLTSPTSDATALPFCFYILLHALLSLLYNIMCV